MVALFKERSPITIFWLLLLSVIVHSQFIVDNSSILPVQHNGLLSAYINHYAPLVPSMVIIVAYHLLVLVQALRLNYLFTDNRMYSSISYLPAMVYVLLTATFVEFSSFTPALVDNIIVIWLFAKTVKLYNAPNPKTLLFDIGLIIGVSIILYHPSALLILVAFFALMVVRPFIASEWVVLIMGVLFPYYMLAAYLYLTSRLSTIADHIPKWALNLPDTHINVSFFITTGLIILILIIGLFYWQRESLRLLIHVRKNWGVLMVMLLIMLPIPFINKDATMDSLLLWIVPASPFIAKGFLAPRKPALPNLMFWSLLLLCLAKNWKVM